MSEELLKAIIQLFAIVAREHITDDERNKIKDFLSQHLNRDAVRSYLELFERLVSATPAEASMQQLSSLDEDTRQFVGDWSHIMQIARQVNQALTVQQKLVLVVKIIELVYSGGAGSERQENLVFYIAQALKVSRDSVRSLRSFVMGQDADELASKDVLIIDEGSGDGAYPGPHIVSKDLTGLVAILRLEDAETYFIKYLGISTLYLNSILLKSRRIDVFPTGSTIRGDKTTPIYYSDVVGKFLTGDSSPKITFTAEHLFYHFRTGRAGLQNISIAEQGGKLIGIMGASGSGKSTLLNVLNGSEKPSSGRVLINDIDVHSSPEQVQGIIGYIPQDDLLMEDLTVFENLYYAAKLCFRHYTHDQIVKLVMRVLQNLGLSEIRDLKVGSPLQKTISGGQRKRLNIALELLREPMVLFVDEPTSGLSSRDSENIMDLLKELALRGKMVFVVIHQPSSDIFKMFDSLVILDVGGFQIYYGNPIEAVLYFRDIMNTANKNQGACPECGNINPEQIFNIIETKIVNEYGRITNSRKISPGQWYQYFKQRIKIPGLRHSTEALPVTQQIPGWFRQLDVFLTRDLLAKGANKQYLYINLFEAPVLSFFIAYMVKYYNIMEGDESTYSFYDNQNVPVYFFMSVVVALFFGLTMSAEEIYRDKKILKREKFLHLSRSSYLTSKVMIMFIISAIQTLSFMVVGNLILEIPLSEIRYWFILLSCSCFANMLGLNISSAFNSAVTIYILIPVLVIPQLLLSGVVIRFDKFNPRVSEPVGVPLMGEIMASRWAFEAYMVTQFRDNPFEEEFYELDKTIASSEYKKTYYIPALESKLAYCLSQRNNWRNERHAGINNALALLRYEIGQELLIVGDDNFGDIEKLQIGVFDSLVHRNTASFLSVLKRFYANRMNKAIDQKEQLIAQLTDNPQKEAIYRKTFDRYMNEAVAEAVRNINTPYRIIEYEGQLRQKIYPIFNDSHRPRHLLDFSADLYQPSKHFAGHTFNTFYFNLAVIWMMTIFLFVTLYFDVLGKAVVWLEGTKKFRRKEKDT